MDAPSGQGYQGRLTGKDPDKVSGHNPGEDKHHGGKTEAQQQNIFFCLLNPVHSFCPVIIAEDSLCSAGDSQHRTCNEHHIALDNGGTGDEHIPLTGASVLLQHGVQNNNDDTVSSQDQNGETPEPGSS